MNDVTRITRVEAQAKINQFYMESKIDREDWSRRFDELSSNRWGAEGRKLAIRWPEEEDPIATV
jgi:hypothetical protein